METADLSMYERLRRSGWVIACVLGFLLIVVVRLSYVSAYASALPFWDQWDAEIALLLAPYSQGSLPPSHWIAPHNEHRILFTRLISLAVFEANGDVFDNRVTASINAILFSLLLAWIATHASRGTAGFARGLIFIAALVIGLAPTAWDNVINGFNNQYYLMIGFGLLLLHLTTARRPAITPVALVAACSIFTMAPGLLVLPVAAALVLLRTWRREAPLGRSAILVSVLLVTTLGALLTMPHHPGHEALRAQDVGELLAAAGHALSWPFPWRAAAFVLWLPTLFGAWSAARRSSPSPDRVHLWLVGMGLWGALQAFAMAYSRGASMDVVPPRYTDMLAISAFANFVLALRMTLRASWLASRSRAISAAVASGLLLLLCAPFVWQGSFAPQGLRERHGSLLAAEHNVRMYLESGDLSWLEGKGPLDISYPYSSRLAGLLDDPVVVHMLPPAVRPEGVRANPPGPLTRAFEALLSAAPGLRSPLASVLLVWVAIMGVVAFAGRRRSAAQVAGSRGQVVHHEGAP